MTNIEDDRDGALALTTVQVNADGGVTLNAAQAEAFANTIGWNVDMDTVRYDNAEPGRAAFLAAFCDAVLGPVVAR